MLLLAIGVVLTAAMVITFVSSAFIIFIILTSKQYKSSTSLLHLQLMGTSVILSLVFIIFSTPSFLQGKWLVGDDSILRHSLTTMAPLTSPDWGSDEGVNSTDNFSTTMAPMESPYSWILEEDANNTTNFTLGYQTTLESVNSSVDRNGSVIIISKPKTITLHADLLCRLYGFLFIMFHTIAVWVVIGLHCDKYCAIATPLRYNQLVTRHRIAAFSVLVWFLGVGLAFPPLVGPYTYSFAGGVCLPVWHRLDAVAYTWTLATLCIILPFIIIIIVNGRIIIIARHHQHRIFSAIFEVMMSAQATVTHQKNPFDVPKKKRKSVWTVLEQIAAFVICYFPFFVTIIWESFYRRRVNQYLLLLDVIFLILAPVINSFIYGIKCKNIRKAFRNYLRKKLYKTEVKHEIQARIPSATNSRRPSISSTLAMPILQKSLQRRMSDYLLQDQMNQPKLLRRSSDMSWHPLEDGTPSPTRLRKPIDTKVPASAAESSPVGSHSPASDTNFLTVPTFEAARSYYLGQQRVRLSISSLDSDMSFSVRESRTEEENLTSTPSPDNPSRNVPTTNGHNRDNDALSPSTLHLGMPEISNANRSKSLELPLVSCQDSSMKPNGDANPENKHQADCQTPLLCKTFEQPKRSASLTSSSPYVLRTLEAILSVRISQSLLRRGSGWGGSLGSIERLSKFLRESRRSVQPESNSSYFPITPLQLMDNTTIQQQEPNNKIEDGNACPENGDLGVLTFINPLPNGGPCVGACNKEATREMETTLTVT
ncbi:uncharacterized protein [Macrobrachium rosenbergii]|uniref:uncharacterized protein n=1 Tax=Macrobrachium rosenbergii TaxID=79674 RepID=UPI0034D66C68